MTIQRSKGYATRPTFSVEQIGQLIAFVKSIRSDILCMVDNCYGEFVEVEPSDVGRIWWWDPSSKTPAAAWLPLAATSAAPRPVSPGAPTGSLPPAWARRWGPIWG